MRARGNVLFATRLAAKTTLLPGRNGEDGASDTANCDPPAGRRLLTSCVEGAATHSPRRRSLDYAVLTSWNTEADDVFSPVEDLFPVSSTLEISGVRPDAVYAYPNGSETAEVSVTRRDRPCARRIHHRGSDRAPAAASLLNACICANRSKTGPMSPPRVVPTKAGIGAHAAVRQVCGSTTRAGECAGVVADANTSTSLMPSFIWRDRLAPWCGDRWLTTERFCRLMGRDHRSPRDLAADARPARAAAVSPGKCAIRSLVSRSQGLVHTGCSSRARQPRAVELFQWPTAPSLPGGQSRRSLQYPVNCRDANRAPKGIVEVGVTISAVRREQQGSPVGRQFCCPAGLRT